MAAHIYLSHLYTDEELIQIIEQTMREKERQQAEGELATASSGYVFQLVL